jgi:hypothetical protein
MKKPVRTDPINISSRRFSNVGNGGAEFAASARWDKKWWRATSTSSSETAAFNLAKRYFWGGATKHFAGPEERDAIFLDRRGEGLFRAFLKSSGGGNSEITQTHGS